jgi:dolichol-phosphate mannosyltransferase
LVEAVVRGPVLVFLLVGVLWHPPGMLPVLVRLAADHDLVLGSRYVNGITVVNWPIERLLLSFFGNLYVRRILSLPVRVATGGF